MPEVLSIWHGVIRAPDAPRVTMAEILQDVADKYRLTLDELKGPDRSQRVSWPRQEAMWRMRQEFRDDGTNRWSTPRIGQFLGGRDHTTVLFGVTRHEERIYE